MCTEYDKMKPIEFTHNTCHIMPIDRCQLARTFHFGIEYFVPDESGMKNHFRAKMRRKREKVANPNQMGRVEMGWLKITKTNDVTEQIASGDRLLAWIL